MGFFLWEPERKRPAGTMFPQEGTPWPPKKAAEESRQKRALKKYQSMRDFAVTAEPSGQRAGRGRPSGCALSSRSMPPPGCIMISGWN